MSVTEEMRKVFDACTVMAGVEPDFECVYMTKGVALLYLDEIDAENAKLQNDAELLRAMLSQVQTEKRCYMADNAKLRELVQQMYPKAKAFLQMGVRLGCNDTLSYDWYLQLRDLGVEVDA